MLNKKIIIIIILGVLIFFLSAALVFFLVKKGGNIAVVNNSDSVITGELKNYNPSLSSSQLKLYADIAAKGSLGPCLDRADQAACISSVGFLIGDKNLCNGLDNHNNDNSTMLYAACAAAVLKKNSIK